MLLTRSAQFTVSYVSVFHMTTYSLKHSIGVANVSYVLSLRDINTYSVATCVYLHDTYTRDCLDYYLLEYARHHNDPRWWIVRTIIHRNCVSAFKVLYDRGLGHDHYDNYAIMFDKPNLLEISLSVNANPREYIIQTMIERGMTGCLKMLANRRDPELQARLLGHAIGYSRVDSVRVVLDAGGITVNDHPRHFLTAVKKKKYDIVQEFIRRGVSYDDDFILRNTKRDQRMRNILEYKLCGSESSVLCFQV